eukprot:scaffold274397_cov35-Tisochrysis_lutea.AAC.3
MANYLLLARNVDRPRACAKRLRDHERNQVLGMGLQPLPMDTRPAPQASRSWAWRHGNRLSKGLWGGMCR